RVGGEEFAVIWYDLPPGSARTQAERVRQAVVDRRLEHPTDRQLSVSIGCTQLIPRGGLTLSDALAVADSALYSAKSNGRNCVEYVPPPRELDSQRWSQPTAVND
ncbi:MAG: GGDEF domain-containing protein, partial [Abyssibacter sp.]